MVSYLLYPIIFTICAPEVHAYALDCILSELFMQCQKIYFVKLDLCHIVFSIYDDFMIK